jgi:hypothetical protein
LRENGPYTIRLVLRDRSMEKQKPAAQEAPVISIAFDAPLSHAAAIRSERLLGNGKKDEERLLALRKGTAEHNHSWAGNRIT